MTAQQRAFDPGPATGNLNPRQQLFLDLLRDTPEGLRSIDLGREIHIQLASCAYCQDNRLCSFAFGEGERIGKSLRDRDLAIKRKASGKWQLLHPPAQPFDDLPY